MQMESDGYDAKQPSAEAGEETASVAVDELRTEMEASTVTSAETTGGDESTASTTSGDVHSQPVAMLAESGDAGERQAPSPSQSPAGSVTSPSRRESSEAGDSGKDESENAAPVDSTASGDDSHCVENPADELPVQSPPAADADRPDSATERPSESVPTPAARRDSEPDEASRPVASGGETVTVQEREGEDMQPAEAEEVRAEGGEVQAQGEDADKSKRHIGIPQALRVTEAPPSLAAATTPEAAAGEEIPPELIPIQRGKTFCVNYLGSTQLLVDGTLSKNMRVTLAYEAVSRVKQPEGESQPLVPVHFFVSTDSVKVIHRSDDVTLMDHPLRSISYVADIGKLVVVMARRRLPQQDGETGPDRKSKLLCHVLESEEAHHISETIGFAFNYAYRQFLSQNGIEEGSLAVSDYADILSVQKMPHDELTPFIVKGGEDEFQLVKKKGEPLGISIMESGWGSMIPTVTVSHLLKAAAAMKSNRINVGDQLLAVAGKSLVGIPIVECVDWLKSLRYLTMVKVKLVHTPPVVDVNIVRPDLKFPLGFSVLEGTVTSLLRGSIGERGGIRVGHQIIDINGQSTVNMKAGQLLDMLSTSTGHIRLKTMSVHLYRVMTGDVVPESL